LRSQRLLFPTDVAPLAPLADAVDSATRFGFELRPKADRVSVHAIPRLFAGTQAERLLAPLVHMLSRGEDPTQAPAEVFVAMAEAMAPAGDVDAVAAMLEHEPACAASATVKRVSWDALSGARDDEREAP
jgi:hypothetical protein